MCRLSQTRWSPGGRSASDRASGAPAFAAGDGERWRQLRAAHTATGPMFWGERIALEDACGAIRTWIADELGS